ncbi:MAG: hypothetical protein DMG88_15760 [Acidobacteria bacterium]|nr:MAG: hypothetical protein DMG88_15760 [Acidobacteriota bacterium]
MPSNIGIRESEAAGCLRSARLRSHRCEVNKVAVVSRAEVFLQA